MSHEQRPVDREKAHRIIASIERKMRTLQDEYDLGIISRREYHERLHDLKAQMTYQYSKLCGTNQ